MRTIGLQLCHLTHTKACCYYGSGSKWCTVRSSDSHFYTYNRDGKLFYFLDKKASTNDRFYKVAMLQKYTGEQQFFDVLIRSSSKDGFLELLSSTR